MPPNSIAMKTTTLRKFYKCIQPSFILYFIIKAPEECLRSLCICRAVILCFLLQTHSILHFPKIWIPQIKNIIGPTSGIEEMGGILNTKKKKKFLNNKM